MNATAILFAVLIPTSYLIAPGSLVWGWARWAGREKVKTVPSVLSLTGFSFATASAVLAISTIALAQLVRLEFSDPILYRAIGCGFIFSLSGLVFGLCGLWRQSSLRWHAPVAALSTFAFWLMATYFVPW